MAHQGTKFDHTEELKGYFLWMDAIEFQMLRLPRPDLSLILRVPADVAYKLIGDKAPRSYTDEPRDLHENDLKHLTKSVEVYDHLCQLFPKDFKQVDCVRGGQLLSVEIIHNLIWETVRPMLPLRKNKSRKNEKDNYYVPRNLDDKTATAFTEIIDQILQTHREMTASLSNYIKTLEPASQGQRLRDSEVDILRAALPIAVLNGNQPFEQIKAKPLQKKVYKS
jgi:hypothetical protein